MKKLFDYLIYMHITTNPQKMIMSAYHTIKKLGHNIVLKEINHLTGMVHCASFSGMNSSDPEVGGQSTISLRNVFFLFSIFLQSVKNIAYEKYIL
jgi:hypothetical protein